MLSGATMLIGGTALLLGSLGWEPNSTQSVQGPATFGWLFLLLFGSLVGYSLYMQLLRDLGPAASHLFLLSLRSSWASLPPEKLSML
jgi:drug/metabolite transporter (DMT)-like permease